MNPHVVIEADIPYHLFMLGAIVGAVFGVGGTVASYALDAWMRRLLRERGQ